MDSVNLVAAAMEAARSLEAVAAECGATYHAAQNYYGVYAEALVGDEWLALEDIEDDFQVVAVRLYDCDGERGEECRTVSEVAAERERWIELLKTAVP